MQHAKTLPDLVLDRYRLVRKLGSGGFGTVWLADDVRLGRPVAVKRVPTESAEQAERARREGLAAARLSHPGIVALYEAGADESACYLVSELVRGGTLDVLEAQGALSDRDVVEIGIALCEALAHAHARGVVHRDVKPGNVIVPEAPEDGGPAAKLTDFGIARVVGDDALTRTGDVLGTLAYMAPEQAEGRGATRAGDLYALGIVLYEALAGLNPVRGATPAETIRRLAEPVPPLGRYRRDLPRSLGQAIDEAVSVEARSRGTLNGLRGALAHARGAVSDEPGVIDAPGFATSITRSFRREPDVWPREEPPPAWFEEEHACEEGAPPAPRPRIPARAAAALAAGGLAAAALALLPIGAPPVPPALAAAAVAAAVLLLPRLGWLAATGALVAWLVADGQQGIALLVLVAAAPVPLLLPRAGVWWSAPAAAPLLGLLGLAPAYAALAGQAATWPRRAGLGALGALWLVLAEPLVSRTLLAGPPEVPGGWSGSVARAADDVVGQVLDLRALALAAVFAAFAVVLPWVVRGRSAGPDAVAATAWAAGLGAAVQAAVAPGDARGAVAGAIVAGVLALALQAGRARPTP